MIRKRSSSQQTLLNKQFANVFISLRKILSKLIEQSTNLAKNYLQTFITSC